MQYKILPCLNTLKIGEHFFSSRFETKKNRLQGRLINKENKKDTKKDTNRNKYPKSQ